MQLKQRRRLILMFSCSSSVMSFFLNKFKTFKENQRNCQKNYAMFQNFSWPDEMLNVTSTPGSSCWTRETISVSRDERGWLMMTLLCEAWSRVTVSHWVLSSVGVVTRHREDDLEQCGQWRPGDSAVSVEQRQSISEQRLHCLHWLLVLVCTSFPLLHWSHWSQSWSLSRDNDHVTPVCWVSSGLRYKMATTTLSSLCQD